MNKNVGHRPTLIIIPILNGEIASSLPSSGVQGIAKITSCSDVVAAITCTSRSTDRSRTKCILEYPYRICRGGHSTPTFIPSCFTSMKTVFWICMCVYSRCCVTCRYSRQCIICKCYCPSTVRCICVFRSIHRRIQDNGRIKKTPVNTGE